MKRGQELEGKVEKLTFPNKGIVVTEEGDKIKVKGVLPGQRVKVRVKKSGKDRAEGRLIELISKSEDEIEDMCPHFGTCGGCTYQTLPYDYQLRLKETMVKDLLVPVIGEDIWNETFEGVKASPKQFEYRNKMEFSFGDEYKDGPLSLGMHKKGSFYDVVNVENCQIVDEDFRTILKASCSFFAEKNVPYRHKDGSGYLRHLLVRKAVYTQDIMVDLITTTDVGFLGSDVNTNQGDKANGSSCEIIDSEASLLKEYVECLLSQSYKGNVVGILHTKNDRDADVVEDQGTDILYGQDYFYEKLLGLSFKITPFSFFQTNSLGAEVLYSTARDFILGSGGVSGEMIGVPADASTGKVTDGASGEMMVETTDASTGRNQRVTLGMSFKDSIVYDLYSGTGTIAQILSPAAKQVIGVEIVEEAVEAAKENAALNELDNCTFLAGDVLKVLDDITEKPDFIVLDPPRDGIHPKALSKIIDYGVDRMIYISCKPSSLARDLEVFLARGYKVDRIACVDMFAGTYHVETVCLLINQNAQAKHHVNVGIDAEDYYKIKEGK